VYVAASAQPTLDKWGDPVATKSHTRSGTTTIDLKGKQGGAVLIWLTDLGDEPGGQIHAHINEVQITAE
jgi:hypothetical protein